MNTTKKYILTLFFMLPTLLVFATEQYPDLVIFQGRTFYISGTFDEDFPIYVLTQDESFAKKLEKISVCYSSGCYRGYQATWEIIKGKLYLKELKKCCTRESADLEALFGERFIKGKGVWAFWVDEPITIGTKTVSVFNLEEPVNFIVLNMENGNIRGVRKME